jgi:hypothetical protein
METAWGSLWRRLALPPCPFLRPYPPLPLRMRGFVYPLRYHGSFANNMKNGQGEQAYPNRDVYRGAFEDDDRHGYGVVLYVSTGDVFRGMVRLRYHAHVRPRLCDAKRPRSHPGLLLSCVPFAGQFCRDVRMNDSWEGIFHFSHSDTEISGGKGRYEGPFRGLLPDGVGTCVYLDGGRYSGDWTQGRFNGQGHLLRGYGCGPRPFPAPAWVGDACCTSPFLDRHPLP